MELLDRYLAAVGKCLPKAQRNDIIAELSDSLQSQMSDKEAQAGRPLTRDEQAAILKAYGHPRLVAARYNAHQFLIGPALLPFYWHTLKVVLTIVLALELGAAILSGLIEGNIVARLIMAWGVVWSSVFVVIGIITVIFAAVEYSQARFGDPLTQLGVSKWDPRKLPAAADSPVPRSDSALELFFNTVFFLWLLNVPYVRNAMLHGIIGPFAKTPLHLPFQFAPAWQPVLPLFVIALAGLLLASGAVNVVNLIRPDWLRLRLATRVIVNGIFLFMVGYALRIQPFIAAANAQMARHAVVIQVINETVRISLIIAIIICLVQMFFDVRRLLPPRGPRLAVSHKPN